MRHQERPSGTTRPGSLARLASAVRRTLPFAALDAVFVRRIRCGPTAALRRSRPRAFRRAFVASVPLVVGISLTMNWLFGLYARPGRHAGGFDVRRIILASISTGLVVMAVMVNGPRLLPLSVVGFGCLLSMMLCGAVRLQARLFHAATRGE